MPRRKRERPNAGSRDKLRASATALIEMAAGALLLLAVLLTWAVLLCVGVALIIQPNLGAGTQAMQAPTPQDFITALVGISMASLTIIYLMLLCQNLLTRNALPT